MPASNACCAFCGRNDWYVPHPAYHSFCSDALSIVTSYPVFVICSHEDACLISSDTDPEIAGCIVTTGASVTMSLSRAIYVAAQSAITAMVVIMIFFFSIVGDK